MLVLAGYLIPWAWTGFRGNSLWDWLNLVALPLAVALAPLLPEVRERWERTPFSVHGQVGLGFAVVVLAGYLARWGWTGFTGNTLWDWLHLLLLPLLVPTVLVPALRPVAEAPMVPVSIGSETDAEVGDAEVGNTKVGNTEVGEAGGADADAAPPP